MWTTGSQLELGLIQPGHCSSRFNPPGEQRAVTSQHFQDWNVWHPRIPADSDLPSGSSAGWEPRAAVPDLSGEERGKPWCSQKGKRRTLCSQNGKGQILMLPEWKEANPGAPRIERGKSWCSQKGKGANPGAARKERGKSWCFQKGKRDSLVLPDPWGLSQGDSVPAASSSCPLLLSLETCSEWSVEHVQPPEADGAALCRGATEYSCPALF